MPEPPELPAWIELHHGWAKSHGRFARRPDFDLEPLAHLQPAAGACERIPLRPLVGGNEDVPHLRGGRTDADLGVDAPHARRSTATAVASPPPMQSEATPFVAPYFSMAPSNVTRIRAPDAPIG